MTDAGLSIAVTGDWRGLEPAWRAIERTGAATAFQTFGFVAPLYAAFERTGRAEAVVAVVRDDCGVPVMLLPLCRHRRGRLSVISGADLRVADYCAPVLAPGFDPDMIAFRAIWSRLVDALPASDVVHLTKIPERVEGRRNPLMLLEGVRPFVVDAHGFRLRLPFDDFLGDIFSGSFRADTRKKDRKLGQLGEVGLDVVSGAKAEAALDRLFADRMARFAALDRPDILADAAFAEFYRDVVTGRTTDAAGMIVRLTLDGEQIAALLGFDRNGSFAMVMTAFDMARFPTLSVGRLALVRAMRHFAEIGHHDFDLTIGDEGYKQQMGADTRPLHERMEARSMPGRAAVAAAAAKRALKRALRRHPRLLALAKRATGR